MRTVRADNLDTHGGGSGPLRRSVHDGVCLGQKQRDLLFREVGELAIQAVEKLFVGSLFRDPRVYAGNARPSKRGFRPG